MISFLHHNLLILYENSISEKCFLTKKPFSGLKDRICRDSFLPHKLCLCARFEFGYYAFKGFT